jgi:glycosyltransferase involved in cell wall biosynthesis
MRPLVILPTYNEAQNIPEVLQRLRAAVPDAEMLVVDDSSPDGTADLAEQAGKELGGVHVLRRPGKAGLGPAYVAGFHWALERGYDVVVQMDADLSHDPAAVPSLLAAVDTGADFAVGSRYVPGGSIPDWPWHRRALSRWGNRYARLMLGLFGHDATSGFRAVRAGLLKEAGVTELGADGYGFLIEELYSFKRAGAHGIEVPIVFRDRTRGASKMSSRIIVEALVLVTVWGMRDWARARVDRRRRHRRGA